MKNDNKVYYKVLDKNMKSPVMEFQYKLGKAYFIDKPLNLYNGFHACKEMYELLIYTQGFLLKECRFFECTLGDKIIDDNHNVASNSIKLTKEISFEEVDKSIRDNLDTLVHDKNLHVRAVVADRGYGLDTLIHDEDWVIRRIVALQGYGLDTLIHDEDRHVIKTAKDMLNKENKK